jgi:hypothetical protein
MGTTDQLGIVQRMGDKGRALGQNQEKSME